MSCETIDVFEDEECLEQEERRRQEQMEAERHHRTIRQRLDGGNTGLSVGAADPTSDREIEAQLRSDPLKNFDKSIQSK